MSVPTSNFQAKPKMQLQAMLQGNIFRLPAPAPRGRDLICVRERVRAATLYTVVVRVVCLSCESMLSDFCLRSLIESLSHVALFRINAVAPAAAATSARRESVGGGGSRCRLYTLSLKVVGAAGASQQIPLIAPPHPDIPVFVQVEPR